jgi:hypothetical protein
MEKTVPEIWGGFFYLTLQQQNSFFYWLLSFVILPLARVYDELTFSTYSIYLSP